MTAQTRNHALLGALLLGLCLLTGCRKSTPPPARPGTMPTSPAASAAPPKELLDLGFGAATAIPLNPLIKDRARAQEGVVMACIKLGLVDLAGKYAEEIPNWRKGTSQASIAEYYARQGKKAEAEAYMKKAAKAVANEEGWRRDRALVIVARADAVLGKSTSEFIQGIEDSEAGKLSGAIRPETQEEFDRKIKLYKDIAAKNNYDLTNNVLGSAAELYASEFDDTERRAALESFCRESWQTMPAQVRIGLLSRMAEAARDHARSDIAVKLATEAQAVADGANWPLRFGIPVMARLARVRYVSGDQEKARAALGAVHAEYKEKRDQLLDIDRAGVLLPIAEAYQAMGDSKAAMNVYRQTIREALVNPNSRPRATDLSAICCSMAVTGVTPDKELWAQLREARKELGPPW